MMRRTIATAMACAAAAFVLPAQAPGAPKMTLDAKRIEAVVAMLDERPAGFGRPIGDRPAWEALAKDSSFRAVIADAEKLLQTPLPEQPDDLYLDFSRTGNRDRWQKVSGLRRGRVRTLALAECLENKGRFIPAFEALVDALCAERTWVMPAHDRSLGNFNGTASDIDLGSSALGWSLATAEYLLGDRLSARTRQAIRDNVRRRILDSFRASVDGKTSGNWWMTGTNNWNAVCLAGVVGAALASVESRQERAFFIVAGEEYSKNFLEGFTKDGYCSEGLGYWNYGFGHYIMLSEEVRQATKGGVDLMAREAARAPAEFAARIEIVNGVYPAFADCSVSTKPDARSMWFVSRRFQLGLRRWEAHDVVTPGGSLPEVGMFCWPNSASAQPPAAAAAAGLGLRNWFEQAGILVCRPQEGSACRMGVALKGGNNAEHHNHNDVGSFVVVLGQAAPLLDPGAETYTARTFSNKRYESKVLNSFGHPVPRVAEKLQRTGAQAQGRVLRADFADGADTLTLDIKSAYDAPELMKLERDFVYSREGAGALTVTDEVAFASPQSFETALITYGKWEQTAPGVLLVSQGDEAVLVEIAATGGAFEVRAEEIKEDVKHKTLPTRIAISFTQPVSQAKLAVRIAPVKSSR